MSASPLVYAGPDGNMVGWAAATSVLDKLYSTITHGTVTAVGPSTGTTIVVGKPSGVLAGDRIVVMISYFDETIDTTIPGFTTVFNVGNFDGVSAETIIEVKERIADGTEGASFTVTATASTLMSARAYWIRGAEDAVYAGSWVAGGSLNRILPGVAPLGQNALLVGVLQKASGLLTTEPDGWSLVESHGNGYLWTKTNVGSAPTADTSFPEPSDVDLFTSLVVAYSTSCEVLPAPAAQFSTVIRYYDLNGNDRGTFLPFGWEPLTACPPKHVVTDLCRYVGGVPSPVHLITTVTPRGAATTKVINAAGVELPTIVDNELRLCRSGPTSTMILNAAGTRITHRNVVGDEVTVNLCNILAACDFAPAPDLPVARGDAITVNGGVASNVSIASNDSPGTTPSVWAYVSGTLPPGMSLASNGNLNGTPSQAGTFTFRYKITDFRGEVSLADVTATVTQVTTPVPGPNASDDLGITEFTVGASHLYYVGWNDSLGTQPATFTLVSGAIPPGLTFTPAGELVGTPTGTGVDGNTGGTYSFVYRITDANQQTDTANASVVVQDRVIIPPPDPGTGSCNTATITQTFQTGDFSSDAGFNEVVGGPNGQTEAGVLVTPGIFRQATPGEFIVYSQTPMPGTSMFVEADITVNTISSGLTLGILGRYSGGALGPYNWVRLDLIHAGTANRPRITTMVGSNTAGISHLAAAGLVSVSPGTTRKLRLEIRGTNYRAFVDGTQVLNVTDNQLGSGTGVGLYALSPDPNAYSFDNFRAGPCA